MRKIDAQIHVWYSDRPSRPWSTSYRIANRDRQSLLQHAGQTNSAAMALEEMAEAGVDGALLAALGVYGSNLDVEIEACASHPDRFLFVGVVDPKWDEPGRRLESLIARGMAGLRIPEMRSAERVLSGEFDDVLAAANELGLSLHLPAVNAALPIIAARYQGIFFYMNHLGTGLAPPIIGFRPEAPFAELERVLELADYPNIGVKLTGAPALSAEDYPYRDIWPPILEVIRRFGADRVSWGSDYTRTAGLLSYRAGVDYLAEIDGLSEEQLELLYGATLMARTKWLQRRAGRGQGK